MYLQKSRETLENGGLFLIATPIGNLEDITLRAVRMLKRVDYILAEDTRVSRKLLHHLEIKQKLVSFHEHNQYAKTQEILQHIEAGMSIGLISDAGMPCISDPGAFLVKELIAAKLPLSVIPGASAASAMFSISGMSEQGQFLFHGFLPTKEKAKIDIFNQYKNIMVPIIFYESPHRILKTLQTLVDIYPATTSVGLARELTKIHETLLWFTLAELAEVDFEQLMIWKGEITFIVFNEEDTDVQIDDTTLLELIAIEIEQGLKPKEAMKRVAAKMQKKPNALYKLWQEKNK